MSMLYVLHTIAMLFDAATNPIDWRESWAGPNLTVVGYWFELRNTNPIPAIGIQETGEYFSYSRFYVSLVPTDWTTGSVETISYK